jgi:hypothetical protein
MLSAPQLLITLLLKQHMTFYDCVRSLLSSFFFSDKLTCFSLLQIVNRYRGKSGPLFNFDVHDDVRLLADATVEKDDSHAGKVVERSWYNRSKHIFPASRWEVFRPDMQYEKYTIHG